MKETRLNVSLVPNLLTHSLIALRLEPKFLSRINPEYDSEYKNWASKNEIDALTDLRFEIEGVSSNANFAFLYQIPAYFSQDNIQSLIETLDLLSSHTLEEFLEHYPRKKQNLEAYVPKELISTVWGINDENLTRIQEKLPEYADLVETIYHRDYQKRWKCIEEKLGEKRTFLEKNYFDKMDWIGEWEKVTSLDFPYNCFDVELIDALATYGTSILAEKDGFYAYGPTYLLVSIISHEIGTHILFNTYTLLNKGIEEMIRQDLETYLKGNELLTWSINKHILDHFGIESPRYNNMFKSLEPMRTQIRKNVASQEPQDIAELFKTSFNIVQKNK